jgi:hypothetical protein
MEREHQPPKGQRRREDYGPFLFAWGGLEQRISAEKGHGTCRSSTSNPSRGWGILVLHSPVPPVIGGGGRGWAGDRQWRRQFFSGG